MLRSQEGMLGTSMTKCSGTGVNQRTTRCLPCAPAQRLSTAHAHCVADTNDSDSDNNNSATGAHLSPCRADHANVAVDIHMQQPHARRLLTIWALRRPWIFVEPHRGLHAAVGAARGDVADVQDRFKQVELALRAHLQAEGDTYKGT